MTEQPPVQSGSYPPPPPPGGSQSPTPGAVWPPHPGQPVDDLSTEAYASWIRRVGAFIIDQLVYLILVAILGLGGGLIIGAAGGSSRLEGIVRSILTLVILAYLMWNWGYRQGTTGSTIGKSVLKFKVVSEQTGQPIGFGLSIVRYFAHFIDSITFGIGYLLPLLTAKRQTIADMIMSTVCLPNEPPPAPRSRTPRPRIRTAVGVVVLAIAAILTVLAYLATTSHWVCTSGGLYPHCGPQGEVDHDYEKWFGPIGYGAYGFSEPHTQAALVPPLWTAGILILRRYYGATYLLVPIAGIVSFVIFNQGRYDWGWYNNYFAFLACVFVTTAVCAYRKGYHPFCRGTTRRGGVLPGAQGGPPAAVGADFATAGLVPGSGRRCPTAAPLGRPPVDRAMAIAGRHTVDITTAALAIFTYDQMDQVRAELNGVSKQTTYATRADWPLGQAISPFAVSQKFV